MNLHSLKPAEGSTHSKKKRLGRGNSSGKGGTSTKGNKGAQSRAGYNQRRGSEGGQMPIHRRLPKRGFKNINRVDYKVLNLGQLDALVERYKLDEVSPESLYITGLVNRTDLVKILGKGELKSKLTFRVNAVSDTAKQAIEAAGGTVEII
ncbi:MAG: 50S ribosomal protein L15 [Chitinophagaceae bacterium]|nr:50S ribosomal protein L15 [Chitinophagaceae bacterium]